MIQKKANKFFKRTWNQRFFYISSFPAFVCLLLFCYIPMVGVVIAFKDFSFREGIFNSAWVGFEHFRALFQDPEFWRAIRNTIAINVLKIIFCFPFPIIFAICLSEMKIKWVAKVSQTLSYLPHFIPWVIVAAIFTNMLTSNGLVNNILNGFGIESSQ